MSAPIRVDEFNAELQRLLGFVRFARTHNERGNRDAVDETLDDAERLLLTLTKQEAP
jgi:hypothetical protein